MNKVMLSIRQEWVNKILDGKKTIEVRKNRPRPKMDGPIKCYIYETKGLVKSEDGRYHTGRGRGAVVAEFVCSTIDEYVIVGCMQGDREYMRRSGDRFIPIDLERLQMSSKDLNEYGAGARLYGLHISGLTKYDTPRDVQEFLRRRLIKEHGVTIEAWQQMKKPPQSWGYVEEGGGASG